MTEAATGTGLRTYGLAFAGCVVLAVLITWPLVLEPSSGLIGHPGNDTWNHAWGMWWVVDGLANRGGIPVHTGLLNYPDGGSLFFIDTFNALWTAPISIAFGLAVAYNFSIFFSIAWTAFGAWCLAFHVTRDRAGATVAAVAFGCNAHLLGQTYNGITETLNAGWIAFFCLAMIRHLERPSLRRGGWMGLCLACVPCRILLRPVLHVDRGRSALASRYSRGTIDSMEGVFGGSVVGALVAVLLVLPVLLILADSMNRPDAMVSRDPEFVWDSLMNHNYTDVVGFFRPGKSYSPDLKAEYGEELIIVTYLGWVLIGLVVLGLVLHRRRKELSLWLWMGLVFLVLRLDPISIWAVPSPLRLVGGRPVPLPFLPFFEAFPLFSRISHPFRIRGSSDFGHVHSGGPWALA